MESLPQEEIKNESGEQPPEVKETLEQVKEEEVMRFSCGKCRKVIFDSSRLEEHTSAAKTFAGVRPGKKDLGRTKACSSLFLE